MNAARRQWLVLGGLFAARPVATAGGLFDPDVREVEVGSSSSGVLDVKTSRRLNVQSTMRTRAIVWVDQHGNTVDTSTKILFDNKYNWRTSIERSTEVWQITAEDLKQPELMVLRVRVSGEGPRLVVSLFVGADSPGRLDPAKGIEVTPSESTPTEWLALFRFDPAVKHHVTVQAEEAERVGYRITVLPARRYRR